MPDEIPLTFVLEVRDQAFAVRAAYGDLERALAVLAAGSANDAPVSAELERRVAAMAGGQPPEFPTTDQQVERDRVARTLRAVVEIRTAVTNLLAAAVRLDRIFWPRPSSKRNAAERDASKERGATMRRLFGLNEDGPRLVDQSIRDAMEHMDEHIDALVLRRDKEGRGFMLFEVFSGNMIWKPSGYSAFHIETREYWSAGKSVSLPHLVKRAVGLRDKSPSHLGGRDCPLGGPALLRWRAVPLAPLSSSTHPPSRSAPRAPTRPLGKTVEIGKPPYSNGPSATSGT